MLLSSNCCLNIAAPDDDKVCGSILLPSYTISPVTKDDGVGVYR